MKHLIFATQAEADAAQQTIFDRLPSEMKMNGTTAYDAVTQLNEGWGFSNPEVSNLFANIAADLIVGFEDNKMDATPISEE